MGRRKRAPAVPGTGLAGKSLSQVAAEARALGLTYGQYTALSETGALERWRRNRGAMKHDDKKASMTVEPAAGEIPPWPEQSQREP